MCKMHCQSFVSVHEIGGKNREDVSAVSLAVDIEVNGLREIEAENAHDRLGGHHIPAGEKIKISIKFCQVVAKGVEFSN